MGLDFDLQDTANLAVNKTLDNDKPSLNPRPQMNGLDQSYSNQNQWFAYLPIESILGKRYSNLDLHLTRFSIPQLEMGSSTVSYKGYQKEISTKVLNAGTKQLTLEYLVDEYWQNYKALWAWLQAPEGVINRVTDDTADGIMPADFLTMRIYLLNNYKKKVIQFEFTNVWIKVFNDLALDYSSSEPVTHSFTCCYDDMRMVEL